jgi:ABC-type multidrug transport system fused ATPase/permease subunit
MGKYSDLLAMIRFLHQRKWLSYLVVSSFLSIIRDLGSVITLAFATDQIVSGGRYIFLGLLAMGLVILLGIPIRGYDRFVKERLALAVRCTLMLSYEDKLLVLPAEKTFTLNTSKVTAQYTGDISRICTWYSDTLPRIIQLVFYLIGSLSYSLFMSAGLTLSTVPVVVSVMPFLLSISKRLTKYIDQERKAADKTMQRVSELLDDPEFIKANSIEETATKRIAAQLDLRMAVEKKASVTKALTRSISYLVSYFPGFFAAVVGCIYLVKGYTTVGFLIGFIQMSMDRFSYMFPQIGGFLLQTNEAQQYAVRIMGFLNLKEEPCRPEASEPVEDEDIVAFRHVSFSYPGRNNTLIDVSFTLPKGKQIALVGGSGSGKSTILRLIMGSYPDYSGSIRVMGREVSKWDGHALRKVIASVFQDSVLFPGTISENIRMANLEATEEEVVDIAYKCGLREISLNTQVGEKGNMVSGGQRQRIAIARAFLKKARLYLLDEPMSALDSMTENQLLKETEQLLQNQTTLHVSHRLYTVQNADCIFFLENGRILESGTHEELIRAQGTYYALYQKQEQEEQINEAGA